MLAEYASENKIDVIGVTETHLVSGILNSFVSIPNYNLFRCDTAGSVRKHGVGVYVHKDTEVDQVTMPYKNIITLRLTRYNICIVTAYRPPSYTEAENLAMIAALQAFISEHVTILIGDFNLPNVEWRGAAETVFSKGTGIEKAFLNMFDSLGLHQWVFVPTYPSSGNILDLVLTTEPDCIASLLVEAPLPGCDHCPVVLEYILSNSNSDVENDKHFDLRQSWHKGNYAKLRQALSQVDWDFELAYRDSNDSFEQLLKVVLALVRDAIPLTQTKPPQTRPPWRVTPPGSLRRQCKRAWETYKEARQIHGRRSPAALDSYSLFCKLNKEVRNFGVKSQSRYERSLIDRWKNNPKLLHAYIRSKKSAPTTVGPLRLKDDTVSSDPKEMSECLAKAFCSVYTKGAPDIQDQEPHQSFTGSMPEIQITVEEVANLLKDIDGNTAMGPDGLHPLVLKNCADALAKPMHTIFTRSLEEGQLPNAWKKSLVIPIFKKGLRLDPLNYRPVCLTSVCCKRLERKLSDHIYNYLDSSSILSSHQFGFRPGHSTTEQLLLVYEYVSEMIDRGETVDVVLFDYSKAFDVVPHSILIDKLKNIGIDGEILSWISSFLMGRTMRVNVQGQLSRPQSVTSGVTQGSVLGPLLFLIYINHIAAKLTCRFAIFADDLKIYACGGSDKANRTLAELESEVQRDIDTLFNTSTSWGLSLNPKKCAVLRFSRRQQETPHYVLNGNDLPSPKSHTDLGVVIDTSLKFHDHISSATRKVAGLGHSFLKSTVCRSKDFMLFFLTVHLRPILEYGSCLWHTGYIGDVRKLERFQRYWTKQIEDLQNLSYGDRLRELDLYSVKGRLVRSDLIQYWKIFHRQSCIAPESMFPRPTTRVTRGHMHKIGVLRDNTDIRKRSFSKRHINLWNNLPESVVNAPDIVHFKRGLNVAISDLLFDYYE